MNKAVDPLVSIIMPCRNAESTLSESVQSVLSQGYSRFELLIVDDGSTDGSVATAQTWCRNDARVKLLFNDSHRRGVSHARNTGLREASGDLIAFLDADDTWFPWALGDRVSLLGETGASIVYGAYLRLLPDGRTAPVIPKSRVTYRDMLYKNHIGNLTGLYDARALGIQFQLNVRHEDYLMWCNLVRRAGVALAFNERPLGTYRVSTTSLSGNKRKASLWHWQVLRTGLQVPIYKAILLQFVYAIHSIAGRIAIFTRINKRST